MEGSRETSANAAPATAPADPAALLRSRQYLVLVVFAAVLGVPVSAVAFGFLKLVSLSQGWVFTDIPKALGFHGEPVWWPVLPLAVGGVFVALSIRYLPGKGGHSPADGFKAHGAPAPAELPGIFLAALATLAFGAVLGPEAPLIALGGGLAAWAVRLARHGAPAQATAVIGAAGSFAAISALFGSPLLAAFLLMEVTGLGGGMLGVILLPGLLASGIGALMFTGLGVWTGFGTFSLAIPQLPHFSRPDAADFGWALAIGVAGALIGAGIRWLGLFLRTYVERWLLLAVPIAGLAVAGLAIAYAEGAGKSTSDVLFSGQSAVGPLVDHAASYTVGALLLLLACKGLAYGVSLSSFRGGPTFPALFIGAAGGILLSHLPGLALVPGVAMGIGAMSVVMLRQPLTSVLLATLLLFSDGLAVMPVVIVAVVVAHLLTARLTPAPAQAQTAAPAPEPAATRLRTIRKGHPMGTATAEAPEKAGRPARVAAPLLSPAEREERGKAARAAVPRQSHAEFTLRADRADPVDLLEEQARPRLPDLVPVRYGRMAESPFAYYRGAALPMAHDLAATPVSGLAVQACGDAHLSNFGVFGSPERRLLFDINDFDETLPGPWEWDVKRLAASLEVAMRDNGFPKKQRDQIVLSSAASYRQAMRQFASMANLDIWYARADVEDLRQQFAGQMKGGQRKQLDKNMAKARTRDSMQALSKLTTTVNGQPRITADSPLVVPASDLMPDDAERSEFIKRLSRLVSSYKRTLQSDRKALLDQYTIADMARKVVGVGSVGTRCWIILMLGRDSSDPLFLQVKEAEESVLARYAGASAYDNQGHRVVAGQRLMQASSDIFLGWQRNPAGIDDDQPHDFYVRQLRDWKFSLDIAMMNPRNMRQYAELCSWTLARAHARSGDRIAIAAYLGGSEVFDRAITEFAVAYADQNERDYNDLLHAITTGRVQAERGV